MADVFGVHPTGGPNGLRPVGQGRSRVSPSRASQAPKPDDLTEANELAARFRDNSLLRMDLVQRVKSEIAAGTYETPERIDATVDRLLEEFFPDLL